MRRPTLYSSHTIDASKRVKIKAQTKYYNNDESCTKMQTDSLQSF